MPVIAAVINSGNGKYKVMWNPFSSGALKLFYYKIVRQEGTPESVARGAALGLFIGFLIPIGLQTVVVIPLAFLFKANKVLSFLFTMLTNPATVFFIYPIQCYIGSVILGNPMSINTLQERLFAVNWESRWDAFLGLGNDIIVTFFVGGALFGILSAPIGYFACYGVVERYRYRRQERLRKRLYVTPAQMPHQDDPDSEEQTP